MDRRGDLGGPERIPEMPVAPPIGPPICRAPIPRPPVDRWWGDIPIRAPKWMRSRRLVLASVIGIGALIVSVAGYATDGFRYRTCVAQTVDAETTLFRHQVKRFLTGTVLSERLVMSYRFPASIAIGRDREHRIHSRIDSEGRRHGLTMIWDDGDLDNAQVQYYWHGEEMTEKRWRERAAIAGEREPD